MVFRLRNIVRSANYSIKDNDATIAQFRVPAQGRRFMFSNMKTGIAELGKNGYSIAAVWNAPVAQLDRAFDYESKGRKFESCRAHFKTKDLQLLPQ
jgi:hypothetical protein